MTISTNNPKVEEIRRSVQSSYNKLNQLIADRLATLDPAKLYQQPAENEWTIMENLAHIVEFMPYWANEIEKLAAPGQNFGRTMRLFAPLYLSNECVNNCRYCGFSRDNPILRVTLNVEEVVAEARYLRDAGFRQILLVAGEHPKFVSSDYLAECVRSLAPDFPSIAIEVGPMASKIRNTSALVTP